ncbi:MAG: PAS domain S-box protein [Nitrospirae bacterium]|nr:PAS domain S-box protein [Nitrospirota bacterium]
MEDISRLNDAFYNFTEASRSLEQIYEKLKERVNYLTLEVERKNKQLEQALCDTEEVKDYLKGILESLSESIIVLDTNERVTMFNKAAERMFGLREEDVIGRSYDGLDFHVEYEGAETFLAAGEKRYNVFLSHANVFDSEGAVRGAVILFQDITRIKELEAQQERNKRLVAMGEMAAQIVHEIRSPLCSIELYASMLDSELGDSPHSNLARGISTGIRSLNNILTNMLLFAKPQKPRFYPLTLSAVLEDSLFMLMPLIESHGISLDRQKESDPCVYGDSELLKQVFMNIIINALQATPNDGTIGIRQWSNEEFAIVDIRDEGEGIRHENLERIFDPFFSTKEKGTGLGLAIASKILLVHDGRIKVESKLGNGSTFRLFLPIKE